MPLFSFSPFLKELTVQKGLLQDDYILIKIFGKQCGARLFTVLSKDFKKPFYLTVKDLLLDKCLKNVFCYNVESVFRGLGYETYFSLCG